MKNLILVAMISVMPAMSFAKVADFNAMISDNLKEQSQLHTTVTESVGEARTKAVHERIVIVENNPNNSYNAPTKKDLLAFKKEKKNFEPSQKVQFERLANEINLSDE